MYILEHRSLASTSTACYSADSSLALFLLARTTLAMGSLVPMTSLAPFPLPEPLPPASTARTVYGPASPYDPNTEHGRIFIKRRDSDMYPLAVDKWLQANQCLWHRDDPRLASTHILSDVVECKVKVLFSPVRGLPSLVLPYDSFCTLGHTPP